GIPQQQAQRPQAYIPKPATDQIPLRPAAQSPADGSKQFNEIFSCDKGSCGLFSFVAPALVLGAGVIAVFASSQPRGVVVGALAFGVGLLYTWCRSVARKGVIAGVIAMVLSLAGITLALTNHADRAQKYAIKFWPTYQTCPFDDCRSKDQKIKTPPKSEKSQQQLPHAPKQPLPEGEQEF
ncbi:MAG: hypothetical protein L6Q71_10655, partial [Planctomycetes bacterium]|nr:hypothetical protein [Planctomycetota bacterium]